MASVFLSKNEPDSGAEPESPHLVELRAPGLRTAEWKAARGARGV